ncbi:MAG: TetR/AcrR family transcriptional regulator [Deltaproteobacteria bacterium]|nr:TetR/AcrR family transcriptional regulator [Deltaproteobacteria bacterium]
MEKGKIGTKTLEEKRDESIQKILHAAMEVFAELGYEGARVDEIAKRSGVNKAMIYYRIGDKGKLYEEVIHYVFGDTVERISKNIKDELSPEEKFKVYLENITKTMAEHPPLPRIMMREIASGWTNFSEAIVKDISGILVIIKGIIDDGVRKGVFIDINPIVVHLMAIGTILLFNLSMPVRQNFYHLLEGKIDVPKDASFEHILPDIEKMMLRALKA